MDLSSQDVLRLNVLLTQQLHAVRIDEASMTLFGLTEEGEARLRLHPDCRDDQYLKKVREFLSNHVLGSPGGYPVYLKRWTRMGQARDESLSQLLKLGEPEAVVAVVHASGLTDDLARKAWWAMPIPENARVMLTSRAVVEGGMGEELAGYLDDYLPFEEDHAVMIDTVRLILQPGLLDADRHASVWRRAQSNNTYLVGFLQAMPHDLPLSSAPRPDYDDCMQRLQPLIDAGNPCARLLATTVSAQGQAFLAVASEVMRRPATQEVVIRLFEEIARYFGAVCPSDMVGEEDINRVMEYAQRVCSDSAKATDVLPDGLRAVLEHAPHYGRELAAMLVLAALGYAVLRPVFSRTTAVGSLMARKLEPVLNPVLEQIACLQGGEPEPLQRASRRRRRG